MDDNLFLARMKVHNNSVPNMYLSHADTIMNVTFDRDANYKVGNLYDVSGNFLELVDYKYQRAYSYSINKDKVEFLVQFRPKYHPELKYIREDGIERYGFYLDVPNDAGDIDKWLILGKNETNSFTRYNILKCNWTFNWIHNGVVYHVLGVLRNRNNYNSGVWSDGFTTTVENEAMLLVPSNNVTHTIDYDMRFMISDNPIHPKVYRVTKVEDTFPTGTIRITLKQDHFNSEADNVDLMVCDYYSNAIEPRDVDTPSTDYKAELKCSGSNPVLHIDGSKRRVTATVIDSNGNSVTPVWHFFIGDAEKSIQQLAQLGIVVTVYDPSKYDIKAVQGSEPGTVLTIKIYNGSSSPYMASCQLEVQA